MYVFNMRVLSSVVYESSATRRASSKTATADLASCQSNFFDRADAQRADAPRRAPC